MSFLFREWLRRDVILLDSSVVAVLVLLYYSSPQQNAIPCSYILSASVSSVLRYPCAQLPFSLKFTLTHLDK